jgi:hypothetical protein
MNETKIPDFKSLSLNINNNNKQFPQIIQWVKNKSLNSTNWILEFIGRPTYGSFQKKFQSRKPNMAPIEFAEMFWNELQVMKISSSAEEKKYVDGYINRIVSQYEDDRKHFNDRLAEEKAVDDNCYTEIEHYISLLDITMNELTNILPYRECNAFVLNAFQVFKRNVYTNFRRIYTEPHTDSDLISIIQQERNTIHDKLRTELNRVNLIRQSRRNPVDEVDYGSDDNVDVLPPLEDVSPRQNPPPPPKPPKPYTKHGFLLLYKELLRASENKECTICLEAYKPDDSILILDTCKHSFHKSCLEKCAKQNCPVCRADA